MTAQKFYAVLTLLHDISVGRHTVEDGQEAGRENTNGHCRGEQDETGRAHLLVVDRFGEVVFRRVCEPPVRILRRRGCVETRIVAVRDQPISELQ